MMETGKSGSKGHEWKVTSSLSAMAEARGDRKASGKPDGAGLAAGGEYRLNREGYSLRISHNIAFREC